MTGFHIAINGCSRKALKGLLQNLPDVRTIIS